MVQKEVSNAKSGLILKAALEGEEAVKDGRTKRNCAWWQEACKAHCNSEG